MSSLLISATQLAVAARLIAGDDALVAEGGVLAALVTIIACATALGRVPRKAHLCDAAIFPTLLAVHCMAPSAVIGAHDWVQLQLRCSLCSCALAVAAALIGPFWSARTTAMAVAAGSISAAALVQADFNAAHAQAAVAAALALATAAALRSALPGSFTLGEAILFAQVASAVLLDAATPPPLRGEHEAASNDAECLLALLESGVAGTLVACTALALTSAVWRSVRPRAPLPLAGFAAACAALCGGLVLPWCAVALQRRTGAAAALTPLAWLTAYFHRDGVAAAVVAYWIVALAVGLVAIDGIRRRELLRPIEVRKLFHVLALALFVPAALARPHLLALAYGVAFCAGVLLECTRLLRIPRLAAGIERYLRPFTDGRDYDESATAGGAITTHLYLLLGLAAPLWLHLGLRGGGEGTTLATATATATAPWPRLLPMCGLVAIGVGDAAAAVVGSRLGKRTHRWRHDSGRSWEGSFAMLVAMALSGAAWLGLVVGAQGETGGAWLEALSPARLAGVAAALVTTTLVEALTMQIDNLIIPLHAYCALALAVL